METLRYRAFLLVLVCGAFLLPGSSLAQGTALNSNQKQSSLANGGTVATKLVMKDGTVQRVRGYQIENNRVRYFSIDRSEWEEIPVSEVDWAATKKAQAQIQQQDAALTAKIKEEEAAAQDAALDVDASLEVVPGVFLPPGDGFFILDRRAIFPLPEATATTQNSKARTIERMVVPLPSKMGVYLPGRHAKFRITNPTPEFYLRTTNDAPEPEVELLQAHIQGHSRHIENIESFFGNRTNSGKVISIQVWQVARNVYRFTLGQSLTPGEYALAEFSPKHGINLVLWDFGVDRPHVEVERKR